MQTRAGGGVFRLFRPLATTTTPLASKCELGVVFFGLPSRFPPPPWPPPSRSNASQRWCLTSISPACHHHHLPRIQTRAGGDVFRASGRIPNTTTSPCIQTRAGGGVLHPFRLPATTTTSLASKREPEVMFFGLPAGFPTPPPLLAFKRELEVI